jgi:hypothetical protein
MVLASAGVTVNAGASNLAATTVSLSKSTRSLSPAFLGFDGENIKPSAVWSNPALPATAASLDYENIRVFGGSHANVWNWRTGHYLVSQKHPGKIPDKPNPPIAFNDWLNVVKAGHAYPVFDMNIMTDTLSDQLAMLHYAQRQGVAIKYVELGNEFYLNIATYKKYFPTVKSYATKANAWIVAIKKAFPGVEVAVVGESDLTTRDSRTATWNAGILKYVRGENAITFHDYFGSQDPGGTVNNAQDANIMLSKSTASQWKETTRDLALLPRGVSAWVTEWNVLGELPAQPSFLSGTWTSSLIQANYALDLVRNAHVELMDNQSLLGVRGLGALINANHGFVRLQKGSTVESPTPIPQTQFLGKGAAGYSLGLLGSAIDGATSTVALRFGSTPTVDGAPGLLGQAFMVKGHDNLFLANLTNSAETITLGGHLTATYLLKQYAAKLNTVLTGNSSIALRTTQVTQSVTLPPWSLTSLVYQAPA